MKDMIEKITPNVSALESGQHNRNPSRRKKGEGNEPTAWCRVAPKKGEPKEKKFNSKQIKHCKSCRGGKGSLTTCLGLQCTLKRDQTKSKKTLPQTNEEYGYVNNVAYTVHTNNYISKIICQPHKVFWTPVHQAVFNQKFTT